MSIETIDWSALLNGQVLWGLLLTGVVYALCHWLYQRGRQHPLLHPVLWSIVVIMVMLWWLDISYSTYMLGGQLIHFMLGPATVALAWPLYQHLPTIRKHLLPILITVLMGMLVGATVAIYAAHWLGADLITLWSLAPKSVTTPVAIQVTATLGGSPALTAGFVIITGILGAMIGGLIFRLAGIDDPRAMGIAMGVSAHGVGTAKAWQINPMMGAYSGLAMALAALVVAFVLPPWLQLLGWL